MKDRSNERPKPNKADLAAELKAAGIERTAYSKREFCGRNGFSENFYDALKKKGLAPRETRVGRRVIITIEAETEWRRQREAESNAA